MLWVEVDGLFEVGDPSLVVLLAEYKDPPDITAGPGIGGGIVGPAANGLLEIPDGLVEQGVGFVLFALSGQEQTPFFTRDGIIRLEANHLPILFDGFLSSPGSRKFITEA